MTDEAPLMNAPESRTPTGEIVDQSSTPTETHTETTAAAPATGAPETYEFKAPEGQQLDAALVAEASPIFKELGLSQDQAQKLVDFYTTKSAATQNELATKIDTMRAEWRDAVMKDPAIGPKLDSVKVELGRAKDQLSPDVRAKFDEAMNTTGLGDHPAVVRALYEMAKLVNEGSHVTGASPSPAGQRSPSQPARPSIAGALYPNLPQ